jgi:DNA recombination protein RmuC
MLIGFWGAAALALVLLVTTLYLFWRRNPLQSDLDAVRTELAVARSTVVSLESGRAELVAQAAELRASEQALSREKSSLETSLTHLKSQLQEVETLRQSVSELGQVRLALTADNRALTTSNDDLRRQLENQKAWVQEQTQRFEERVLAAAAKLMEERGKAFTETNKKEVDAVVAPFREQLEQFRQRVDHIYAAENTDRGELKQQIVQLTTLNQAVSLEAQRLTNALTVTSKSTGDWGETILQKILEDSGLREGKEYRLQHSVTGMGGERLQPDAVIFLPGNRQLIVDSKVSNKAWTAYCGEQDEMARQARLADHLFSLRSHLKGLSQKDYARSPDLSTVDFVLMFVPVEGALLTALTADDTLYSEAFQKKIILVTPSTLMAVVKLAEGLWTLQTRKESADEIAEAGRKLYEKLTNFAETFVEVGQAIERAGDQFDKAHKQLATGKGHAIGLAQKMVALGVSPAAGKVMPTELLGPADSEENG